MKNWNNGIGEKTKAVFVEKKANFPSLEEFKEKLHNANLRKLGIDVCEECGNITEDCECMV